MRLRPTLLIACLLVLAIAGGARWWITHPQGPATPLAPPGQAVAPTESSGVCPGGGDLALAVAGPAAARCTALPVLQPLQPWQPLDPDPTLPTFSHPEPAQRDRYELTLVIEPASGQVTGQMALHLINRGAEPLPELYLHLYPNAPYFAANGDGKPGRPGSLTVDRVEAEGKPLPFTGETGEILAVPLAQPLAPGATLTLRLTYTVIVPSIENDRFGSDARTLFLGNAYPILALHDQAGWHLDRYIAVGDPFYSEVADYAVTVQVPPGYDVAATGRPAPVKTVGANALFAFTAERVRDFGLAVSKGWSRHERLVDGVQVHYLRDETLSPGAPTPKQVLDQIEGAVRFFGQRFGPYPYADLTVVDRVGMEYPQFIMGGPELHTVIHEVAHQWWYGVVGNDELRQIWDEGLTEFSALLYEASVGVQTPASRLPMGVLANWPMDDSLYRYAAGQDRGQLAYGQVLYRRGWRLWEALRQELGDERFFELVQRFYQRHQFGTATWADWRQAVAEAGAPPALALFDQWVYGAPVPPKAPSRVASYID
ncbi:MAG TPA: M1 family metallopeptidase [Symbiobacteriaceae bacterium]|nr:M1 family metallopeptidase [Symbiobacteriaceae bacterium]